MSDLENVEYVELNINNFTTEDVTQLNEWGIAASALIEELESQLRKAVKSRDAWKHVCKYIMAVIGEGGKRGRPMDLIDSKSWKKINNAICVADQYDWL